MVNMALLYCTVQAAVQQPTAHHGQDLYKSVKWCLNCAAPARSCRPDAPDLRPSSLHVSQLCVEKQMMATAANPGGWQVAG